MWETCRILLSRITVVSQVSAHGHSMINLHFSSYWALAQFTGCLQCATIERGRVEIIMGVALARYVHACICTLYIEHVCMIFRPEEGKNSLILESWVELLIRIRERIEIVDVRGSTTPD